MEGKPTRRVLSQKPGAVKRRRLLAKREAKGLCGICGKVAKEEGKRLCVPCKEKHYAFNRRYVDKSRVRQVKHERAIRREVLDRLGGKCACCGESHYEFLAIDHVHGGGSAHRRQIGVPSGQAFVRWIYRNNYPAGFRVLCHNCNSALGYHGHCPHGNLPSQKSSTEEVGRLRAADGHDVSPHLTEMLLVGVPVGGGDIATPAIGTNLKQIPLPIHNPNEGSR